METAAPGTWIPSPPANTASWRSSGPAPRWPLMEWLENLDYSDVPLQFLYTANFPAGETVEVAVSYNTRSDGAREGTADWQHTFTYLLSPARHWASFGTLDVTVDAGESGYPYVIASSLPLEAQPDGSYSAHAEGLPEEDLSFTLYSAPQLSLSDRVTSTLGITTYYTYIYCHSGGPWARAPPGHSPLAAEPEERTLTMAVKLLCPQTSRRTGAGGRLCRPSRRPPLGGGTPLRRSGGARRSCGRRSVRMGPWRASASRAAALLECECSRWELSDVAFQNCDLSGSRFSEGMWDRVLLEDCRALGAGLSRCGLQHVQFLGLQALGRQLRRPAGEVRPVEGLRSEPGPTSPLPAGTAWPWRTAISPARASFRPRCPGVDLTSCRLDGLVLSQAGSELQGAVVDRWQASELAKRLGLVVRDS